MYDVDSACGGSVCVHDVWFRCAFGCRAESDMAGCGRWVWIWLLVELGKKKIICFNKECCNTKTNLKKLEALFFTFLEPICRENRAVERGVNRVKVVGLGSYSLIRLNHMMICCNIPIPDCAIFL